MALIAVVAIEKLVYECTPPALFFPSSTVLLDLFPPSVLTDVDEAPQ